MVRARSKLFVLNLVTAWIIGLCLSLFLIVNRTSKYGIDSWRSNPQTAQNFNIVTTVVLVFSSILAIVLFGLEVRLRKGWEPRWLESLLPGCEILKMTSALDRQRATVMVRLSSGIIDTYEADPQEMRELQIGSISHLWVIGKYISRIRLIEANAAIHSVTQAERMAILPQLISLRTGAMVVIATFISSYCFALGLITAIVREIQLTGGGISKRGVLYSANYSTDSWVPFAGIGLMFFGLAIITTVGFQLHQGWDDAKLEEQRDYASDNRLRSGRW